MSSELENKSGQCPAADYADRLFKALKTHSYDEITRVLDEGKQADSKFLDYIRGYLEEKGAPKTPEEFDRLCTIFEEIAPSNTAVNEAIRLAGVVMNEAKFKQKYRMEIDPEEYKKAVEKLAEFLGVEIKESGQNDNRTNT